MLTPSMSLRLLHLDTYWRIQSRLSNDVGGVQAVVTNTATSIVSNFSTVISTIIAMLFISPLLTLISLGVWQGFVPGTAIFARKIALDLQGL